eukprot:5114500-Pyramimonas_sp.AAC.1
MGGMLGRSSTGSERECFQKAMLSAREDGRDHYYLQLRDQRMKLLKERPALKRELDPEETCKRLGVIKDRLALISTQMKKLRKTQDAAREREREKSARHHAKHGNNETSLKHMD